MLQEDTAEENKRLSYPEFVDFTKNSFSAREGIHEIAAILVDKPPCLRVYYP